MCLHYLISCPSATSTNTWHGLSVWRASMWVDSFNRFIICTMSSLQTNNEVSVPFSPRAKHSLFNWIFDLRKSAAPEQIWSASLISPLYADTLAAAMVMALVWNTFTNSFNLDLMMVSTWARVYALKLSGSWVDLLSILAPSLAGKSIVFAMPTTTNREPGRVGQSNKLYSIYDHCWWNKC